MNHHQSTFVTSVCALIIAVIVLVIVLTACDPFPAAPNDDLRIGRPCPTVGQRARLTERQTLICRSDAPNSPLRWHLVEVG